MDVGSGKTQLCMMACARAAARGEKVVYIDTSNAFTGSRLVSMLTKIPITPTSVVRHILIVVYL